MQLIFHKIVNVCYNFRKIVFRFLKDLYLSKETHYKIRNLILRKITQLFKKKKGLRGN